MINFIVGRSGPNSTGLLWQKLRTQIISSVVFYPTQERKSLTKNKERRKNCVINSFIIARVGWTKYTSCTSSLLLLFPNQLCEPEPMFFFVQKYVLDTPYVIIHLDRDKNKRNTSDRCIK